MEINQQIIIDWLLSRGIKIIAILVVAYLVNLFIGIFIEKSIRKLVPPKHFLTPEAEKKRENTLIRITKGFADVMIWIIAFLMVFQEFGLAIGPFLATLGIAGVAIGFGGQYLIKDIISGKILILKIGSP